MEPQLPRPRNLEQGIKPEGQNRINGESLERNIEKNLSNPEQKIAPVQDSATAAAQAAQMATPSSSQIMPSDNNDQSNPAVAGDDDVIEKEWVDRAKEVVSKTREDPRQQKNEVNMLQADYLEKRYNKKIKINEPNNK